MNRFSSIVGYFSVVCGVEKNGNHPFFGVIVHPSRAVWKWNLLSKDSSFWLYFFFLLQSLVQTKILGAGCPVLYTRARRTGLVKDIANDPPQVSETFLCSSALRGPGKALFKKKGNLHPVTHLNLCGFRGRTCWLQG